MVVFSGMWSLLLEATPVLSHPEVFLASEFNYMSWRHSLSQWEVTSTPHLPTCLMSMQEDTWADLMRAVVAPRGYHPACSRGTVCIPPSRSAVQVPPLGILHLVAPSQLVFYRQPRQDFHHPSIPRRDSLPRMPINAPRMPGIALAPGSASCSRGTCEKALEKAAFGHLSFTCPSTKIFKE